MFDLSEKSILVTAAGRGIGRACALLAADAGANVYATDIDGEALQSIQHERISAHVLDATDPSANEALVQSLPSLDGVVHCVGIVQHGTILEGSANDWHHAFKLNVDSFYLILRAVLPRLQTNGGASIVAISSVASSIKGLPDRASYGATKAAVNGMVKSVAADFVSDKIRCNAICPGTISSPSWMDRVAELGEKLGSIDAAHAKFIERQPLGRVGKPEEVAALAVYLLSDSGAFVTGQLISVDGGISI